MYWIDLAAGVMSSAQSTFGESVTFTPAGGSPSTVVGIFNDIFEAIDQNGGGIMSARPTVGVAVADFSTLPAPGDAFTIRSVNYEVEEVQRDGEAGLVLHLHKVQMSNFSDYTETAICNWLRNNAAMPAIGTRYIALFNGSPTDTGSGGTEVTSLVRVAGRLAITFGTPSNGVITNSADVDFGASANATSVTHFAIFDAATSGNMLMWGALSTSKTIDSSDVVLFEAGSVTVTISQNINMPQIDLTIGGTGTETLFTATTRVCTMTLHAPDSNQAEVAIALNEDEKVFRLQPGETKEYNWLDTGAPFYQGNAVYAVGTVGDKLEGRYL